MYSSVYLAAEDEPGLAVGRRLIHEQPKLFVYREENAGGYGRLKSKARNYENMGRSGLPVLMLTDLDNYICPSVMIYSWLGFAPCKGFLFRICVREIEAWVLADREGVANFLEIEVKFIPNLPESLKDPKAVLINCAQKANRKIRSAFTPIKGAAIGPGYNNFLSEFIYNDWNIESASALSPSLMRAREKLAQLSAQVIS